MNPGGKTVAQICSISCLGEEATALVREDLGPREYVNLLIEKEYFLDTVRFVAHALPKREAVWWAWVSARRACGTEIPPDLRTALDTTEKWIAQPTDENRRATLAVAQQAGLGTAAGCAAMAAYLSGGSLGPPGGQVVPPAEDLTAKTVTGALALAAASGDPEKAPERFRNLIDLGLDVVNRIKLW